MRNIAVSLVGSPAQRPSASLSSTLGFWTLGVAALVNLNHFFNMTADAGWPISLGMAFCCMLLCLLVRIPLRQNLGTPGFLAVAALTSYLVIGLSVTLVTDAGWHSTGIATPLRVGLAILIVIATTLGASMELRRLGIEYTLKRTLTILTVTCILILMTPFLFDYIYTIPPHLSDLPEIAYYRFTGTSTDPNIAGGLACYTAGLALIFLTRNRYRIFAVSALILGSAAVIVSLSRTALLILTGLVLFSCLLSITINLSSKRSLVVPLLTITFVGSACIFAISVIEHIIRVEGSVAVSRLEWIRSFGTTAQGTINTRMTLLSLSWSKIIESPLFGHGLWQFHHLENAPLCRLGERCGSHNSYLMFWGEAGIIPFLLFVFFTGALLWKSWILPRSLATDTIAVLTFTFIISSLGADGSLYSPWHAFILGLVCALAGHATRESRGWQPRRNRHPSEPGARGRASSAIG